jgi:regulator of RNase E activity RraA
MLLTHKLPFRNLHFQSVFGGSSLRLYDLPLGAQFARRMMSSNPSSEQLQALKKYTACDISDALVKLKVPNCGFLPDLTLYSPASTPAESQITIAPASTLLLVPKNAADLSIYPTANIPQGKHWVDLTQPETVVVISQPKGQICAAIGGIMALRMKMLNAVGVVSYGRVRDVEELRETELPVRRSYPKSIFFFSGFSLIAFEKPMAILNSSFRLLTSASLDLGERYGHHRYGR